MIPDVSVVIPTYNRRERLHRVLLGLANQRYDGDMEVVVVSDGSTDGTAEYLESGATPLPVVGRSQVNAGPAAARNRGIELASGDVILFIDDDVVPDPDLVAAHLRRHRAATDDLVVIGPMQSPPDHDMSAWVAYEQAMLAKQYTAMVRGDWEPTPRQFYTGNASVRREHLIATGGFDVTFRRAEDIELALRLDLRGLRFVYAPDAVGWHYAERGYESWKRNGFLYGQADVAFARRDEHEHVLRFVLHHYRQRNALIRAVVRVGIGRPRVSSAIERALLAIASAGRAGRLGRVAHYCCSGIYNLAYYEGVAESLGGRAVFLGRLARDDQGPGDPRHIGAAATARPKERHG